nr:MAG TPA: hypothetical protein [Caudoviricetes sp.]
MYVWLSKKENEFLRAIHSNSIGAALYWYSKNKDKVLSGVTPLTFVSNGKPLKKYEIQGASGGVGDKTSNLLNLEDLLQAEEPWVVPAYKKTFANFPKSDYTLSSDCPASTSTTLYFDSSDTKIGGVWKNHPATIQSATDFYVALCKNRPFTNDITNKKFYVMLNEGGEAAVYEPYGYKIAITVSHNNEAVTIPIYLNNPLEVGDVLRSDGTILRHDGQIEYFDAPKVPTFEGICTLSIDTKVKPDLLSICGNIKD